MASESNAVAGYFSSIRNGSRRIARNVVLIDTRAPADYWAGHLEGALNFDPFPFHHSDTSEAGLREFRGQLEWIFSALGITGDETVVFYENDSGMRATRGAWALDYMGHPARADPRRRPESWRPPRNSSPSRVRSCRRTSTERRARTRSPHATISSIASGRIDSQIFDVRTDEEYFGERVRARHGGAIPGAIHRDWAHNVGADGAFKPAAQLRAEFEASRARPEPRDHSLLPGRLSLG